MAVVDDASSGSLIPFIGNTGEQGSSLETDGWRGYSGITDTGYTQTVHNQAKAQSADEMLPHAHLVLSLLKRWLLGTHRGAVRSQPLQPYLDAFVFRFNRRKSAKRGRLFYRFLQNPVKPFPTTLHTLLNRL